MESNNDIYKFKVPLPKNAFLNRSGGRIKIIQDQNFRAVQLFKEKKAKTEIFDLNSLKQKNYKLQLFRNKKICNTDSYPFLHILSKLFFTSKFWIIYLFKIFLK